MKNKQPIYYIAKKIFGVVIQIPVTASEIEQLHSMLIEGSNLPAEDPVQVSIFGNPEDISK